MYPFWLLCSWKGWQGAVVAEGGRAPGAIWRSPQRALVVAKVLGAARRREVGTFVNNFALCPFNSIL